jgi:hypothetical protein
VEGLGFRVCGSRVAQCRPAACVAAWHVGSPIDSHHGTPGFPPAQGSLVLVSGACSLESRGSVCVYLSGACSLEPRCST